MTTFRIAIAGGPFDGSGPPKTGADVLSALEPLIDTPRENLFRFRFVFVRCFWADQPLEF